MGEAFNAVHPGNVAGTGSSAGDCAAVTSAADCTGFMEDAAKNLWTEANMRILGMANTRLTP